MWRLTLLPATWSPANQRLSDVFVYDRQTDTIERVSLAADGTQANGDSKTPRSRRRPLCGFHSSASNLVPGDTNGVGDTFVYDRQTDTIERVSLAADGTQGNGCSSAPRSAPTADTWRSALTPATSSPEIPMGGDDGFVYDRPTDTIERVSLAADGRQANDGSRTSQDKRRRPYVAFESFASNLVPGDTNGGETSSSTTARRRRSSG